MNIHPPLNKMVVNVLILKNECTWYDANRSRIFYNAVLLVNIYFTVRVKISRVTKVDPFRYVINGD